MARLARRDQPGMLHHVTNRSPGHIPLFETERDVRAFLALLALLVRRGALQVHAYAVLSTHFHLLVTSGEAGLAPALQWLQHLYARWFNRTRARDGHAFKARYFSRPVEDDAYRLQVVAYIDRNPVVARMADHPASYPHGSARFYVLGRGRPWLRRDLVGHLVERITRRPFEPADYPRLWQAAAPPGDELVERLLQQHSLAAAPVHVLTQAGPEHVQRWLRENAQRESGRRTLTLALPLAEAGPLRADLAETAVGVQGPRGIDPILVALAGLLGTALGLAAPQAARILGVAPWSVVRLARWHRERLTSDTVYAGWVAAALHRRLHSTYGAWCSTGV